MTTNEDNIKVVSAMGGVEVCLLLKWPTSATKADIEATLLSATDSIIKRVDETKRLYCYATNDLVKELARRAEQS